MKVSVNCQITYNFELDVPQEIIDSPEELDLVGYCDTEDPAYSRLCDVFVKHRIINWDGSILSIANSETGELMYKGN